MLFMRLSNLVYSVMSVVVIVSVSLFCSVSRYRLTDVFPQFQLDKRGCEFPGVLFQNVNLDL